MAAPNDKLNQLLAQMDARGQDGTPISGNASRDNKNATISASKNFVTPDKSAEKQVTPTADTHPIVQKVITSRKKVYLSPPSTKCDQMTPILNSQGDTTIVQQQKVIGSGTRKKINLSPPMPSQSTQAPIVVQLDKSVEKQVTPTADTQPMVQKVITTRKKVYISPPSTKYDQMPPILNSQEDTTIVQQPMKCTLYTLNLNNPIAYGTVFPSNQQGQTIHGVPLQDDCCRVSVEQVVKGATFLPYEAGDMRTVEDALGSFVAWPKNLIKNTGQVPIPTANEEEESAAQALKKGKRCNTITHSPVTRSKAEANKKKKQRKLVVQL